MSLQLATRHRRIVLARRPNGLPTLDDFRIEHVAVPDPGDGEVLLRARFLSLDPYMRNLMEDVGPVYAPSVGLGEPMVGATISTVVRSRHPAFEEGRKVLANGGWQEYALSDGSDLVPVDGIEPESLALGGLGMPGFTAHVGLLDIGRPSPGETVVVAAATGAVGALVGQIARIRGARVVGIAGGPEKCRHAVESLGFDACLDRTLPALAERLAAACPRGIDVYFENVGGEVFQAVLPLLNIGARVPVCGVIAHYNDTGPGQGPDTTPVLLTAVLQKRIRMQGFVITDHYGPRFDAFRSEMLGWLEAGQIRLREDRVVGLERAPAAFIGLLQGHNFGKVVVRVDGGA